MNQRRERTVFTVGEEAEITRIISDEDIRRYAGISGDENPVHINEEYAKGTMFGGCIVPGMLVAALISAVLGNILPGPGSIYVSQQLHFVSPVRPGDQVTARVRVMEWIPDKGEIRLRTHAINQNRVIVITGEATLVMSSFLTKTLKMPGL